MVLVRWRSRWFVSVLLLKQRTLLSSEKDIAGTIEILGVNAIHDTFFSHSILFVLSFFSITIRLSGFHSSTLID